MIPKFIKPSDIEPGDVICWAVNVPSSIRVMFIDEICEGETNDGYPCVSLSGITYVPNTANPGVMDGVMNTMRQQITHTNAPMVLLLKREATSE